ncbi:hypothetical protein [Cohnella fermenti]|nr:hypothetical protein [Cohnella fermenti]
MLPLPKMVDLQEFTASSAAFCTASRTGASRWNAQNRFAAAGTAAVWC